MCKELWIGSGINIVPEQSHNFVASTFFLDYYFKISVLIKLQNRYPVVITNIEFYWYFTNRILEII